MPMYFDVLMPTILFVVTVVAMFLSKRTETKLKATMEEREFKSRDTALMVGLITFALFIVIFVPSMTILAIFLFSYCSLLFTVSYAFSDMKKKRLILYCSFFIVVSVIAIITIFFVFSHNSNLSMIGTLAFTSLALCSFLALMYALRSTEDKYKWYLAVLSPALFLLLFFFFNGTVLWFPFLLDVYGITFALLIVMYLSSLFNWKTVFMFASLITILDIILVWVTGTMVQAANTVSALGLPVLVAFPTIPLISVDNSILILRLGLGDFFFAGILATQTLKKFGKKTALISILTMSISFGIFELMLLNPSAFDALPATLPIILGWLPVAVIAMFLAKNRNLQILHN
ncbi:MAG: hypothetical protein N3D85_04050 [Candidatus Bathyarchaeota archaeon]|nr:hypothetical protein [Candidatus Bathyarchaeota archaeon]